MKNALSETRPRGAWRASLLRHFVHYNIDAGSRLSPASPTSRVHRQLSVAQIFSGDQP